MFELTGKYASAKVFTDICDNETISQVQNLLNLESMKGRKIRIMPDCHAGAGCVIGTTMEVTDSVIVNLVGSDIGCGMTVVKLKERDVDLNDLDFVIRNYVPSGFKIRSEPLAMSSVYDVKAPVDAYRALCSLGTLGGGNHFIELDRDLKGSLYLVIHTGSRHLGQEVCKYYQEAACEQLKEQYWGTKADLAARKKKTADALKAAGRKKEIEGALKKIDKEYKNFMVPIPRDLAHLTGSLMEDYLHDMGLVQQHAAINRTTIAKVILSHMGLTAEEEFTTVHNYIDLNARILRKGAVSAKKGEKLIIPLNMRDGSLICVGKGNPDWNQSAPHGAGRIMSRAQAKENLSMEAFKETMSGIYTTCVNRSTLDESPFAYKPMESILDNISDTVDVLERIVPIYNFKASE